MKKYKNIKNDNTDDFLKKTEDIDSILLYGDKNYIKKPFITIFIPTYKREFLLKQALKSVLYQHHTDFFWDIVVLDNEEYNGNENGTYRIIKEIDNKRILYYRNMKTLSVCDNFNKGVILSRGTWIMMLHDDDLIISNTLKNIGKLIESYKNLGKKSLGAISAKYVQFFYNDKKDFIYDIDILGLNSYLASLPMNYDLYKLTHNTIWFTSHIGGYVPSNGTTFNKEAYIKSGGINEDYGISGDLILYYIMEKNYEVYSTITPLGFYRWGNNSMSQINSIYKLIEDNFKFREYIYNRGFLSIFFGKIFRKQHYKKFVSDVIKDRNNCGKKEFKIEDFDYIYDKRPNKFLYFIYLNVIMKGYNMFKKIETKILSKKARRIMENE